MTTYQTEIVSTFIVLLILLVVSQLLKRLIIRFVKKKSIDPNRKKIILNFGYFMLYVLTVITLVFIWSIRLKDFIFFLSSILAVLGVGFIAQWSILSNLTSSVILFFNHPMRIGDRIRIVDKDYDWVGVVKDITGFFIYIKTDKGEYISFPNSLVLQKPIEMLDTLANEELEEKIKLKQTLMDNQEKTLS